MRTTEETIATLLEVTAPAGDVRTRKMFGEYALYCDEKVVALVCRDELFVKDTDTGRTQTLGLEIAPAYPGAKPGIHIPKDRWEPVWLSNLIRTTADALPAKKTRA